MTLLNINREAYRTNGKEKKEPKSGTKKLEIREKPEDLTISIEGGYEVIRRTGKNKKDWM